MSFKSNGKEASKKSHIKYQLKCKYCGLEKFTNHSSMSFHEKYCEKNPNKKICHTGIKSSKNWVCKYCGSTFRVRRLLYTHIPTCVERQKTQRFDSLNRVIGYQNHSEIVKRWILLKRQRGEKLGHSCSDETKKKLSKSRIKNLQAGKGNHWISPPIKRSYAENYFFEIFKNKGLNFKNNYSVSLYKLDFVIGKNYFEVDGEQHYTLEGIEHDKIRTDFLHEKGYNLVSRCRWSKYVKLSYEEKTKYVNDVIKRLSDISLI